VGRTGRLQTGQPDRDPDLKARPPRRTRPQRPPAGRSSVCSQTTPTSSRARSSTRSRACRRHTPIHASRPQTNGKRRSAPQDDPRRMLATSLRALRLPAPGGPAPRAGHLPQLLQPRPHCHGRLTRGRIPADIVYGAHKMKARQAAPVGTSRSPPSLGRQRLIERPASDGARRFGSSPPSLQSVRLDPELRSKLRQRARSDGTTRQRLSAKRCGVCSSSGHGDEGAGDGDASPDRINDPPVAVRCGLSPPAGGHWFVHDLRRRGQV
jgi:hypothetical protein